MPLDNRRLESAPYGKYRFKLVRAKVNHGLRDVRMVNIAKVRGQCFPDRSRISSGSSAF